VTTCSALISAWFGPLGGNTTEKGGVSTRRRKMGRRRVSIRARQTEPQGKFVAVVQRQRFGRQKHAAARAEPGENAAQGRFDDQRRRLRGMADLVRPRHRLVEAQFKGGSGTGRGRIEDQFDVFGAIRMEIAAQEQQGRAGGKKKFHRTAGRSSFKV